MKSPARAASVEHVWRRLAPLLCAALLLAVSPSVHAAEQADAQQTLARMGSPSAIVPNDPRYTRLQWNLHRIGVEQLWDLRPTAPDIMVAVLDTGVDFDHPDLRDNVLADLGFDFTVNAPGGRDDESHGTAVAGVIGAVGNNQVGVAGIAWRVKILPIKVLNAQGRATNSQLARAIIYATDRGAQVINVSSTAPDVSAELERAVAYAQEKGALVVAAAGNSRDEGNPRTYPASLPGVLAVGAVDERDHLASFSQTGPYVNILAPGVEVPSTAWPGAGRDLYAAYTGTSIAAPHVAGVAALLWSLRPDLSAADIATVLRGTVDPLPPSAVPNGLAPSAGVLNASKAVAALRLGSSPRAAPVLELPVPTPAPLPSEARRVYFAEGSTNPPFETVFALFNPGSSTATVNFTFSTLDGQQVGQSLQVGPNARGTLRVNAVLPNAEFATVVQSNVPVFVERSMFFGHDGHSAAGSRDPARSWYFAEGSSALPFDTWLLLQNPGASPATVRLRFMLENGSMVERTEMLTPGGRRSLYVNLLFREAGFATQVESDQPIVAERAMYFEDGEAGHNILGTRVPGRSWLLPEGITRQGYDTWLLVQNPGSTPANVRVAFLGEDGALGSQALFVPPRSRRSLLTNVVVPEQSFGMRVESDQPIVVERAIYIGGSKAGFDAAGVATPAGEWFIPDVVTSGSFVTQLAMVNPQAQPVSVRMQVRREDGVAVAPVFIQVPAGGHRTVDLNPVLVDGVGALHVVADRPIAVERIQYFARPGGIGATSSTGQTR